MSRVNAHAEPRLVPVGGHLDQPAACFDGRSECALRLVEGGHHSVAEPLHDLPAPLLDRRLDGLAHIAQQIERGVVARLERPVREVGEVGEDDRKLPLAPPAALRLREPLPELERGQTRLTQQAGPFGGEVGEAAADDVG